MCKSTLFIFSKDQWHTKVLKSMKNSLYVLQYAKTPLGSKQHPLLMVEGIISQNKCQKKYNLCVIFIIDMMQLFHYAVLLAGSTNATNNSYNPLPAKLLNCVMLRA